METIKEILVTFIGFWQSLGLGVIILLLITYLLVIRDERRKKEDR